MSIGQTAKGYWYCQYRIPGKKSASKEYFGKGPDGKRAAEARDLEIKHGKKIGNESVITAGICLDELCQTYLTAKKLEGKSEHYLTETAKMLNQKILPLIGAIPVNKITYTDILKLGEQIPTWSQKTLSNNLTRLRAIFNYGIEVEITTNNPMTKWKPTKRIKKSLPLTLEDLGKIIECSTSRVRLAIEMEWELGARPGPTELFALKWEHINWNKKVITVPGTKSYNALREVPVSDEFLAKLAELKKNAICEYIIHWAGKPLKGCMRAFSHAVKRAKLPYSVRFYDVRHLFATLMLNNGADLLAVSKLLGHYSPTVTANCYYHEVEHEKQRAITLKPKLN